LYTDWLYLWWVAYTNNMHGYIYIILKESLKNIPIIGWGAQFYNFIFLKRKWEQDKASFQQHLNQLNNPNDPMWLLIFPEGTNLAKGTREKSSEWAKKQGLQDMKHQLLPRSKGLQFCLQNLRESTEWLYDCTIGYEGIPPGEFGQDIFTLRSSMFEGRPPKSVNMHFRRFKIADIPIDNDKAFDVWLRNRWREKDYLLEHFAQYNRFPEDATWITKQQQVVRSGGKKVAMPAKAIETQIKSNSLEEFLSIFAPLSSVMTVLFLFYGGGKPEDMLKMIGEAAQQQQKVALVRDDESEAEPLKLRKVNASEAGSGTEPASTQVKRAPKDLTAAKAQQNLVQQYVQAIRPVVEKQVNLPENALRISNAGKGEFSPRSNQKPGTLTQKKPAVVKKAATTVPDKPPPQAPKAGAATVKRATSAAPAAPASKPLGTKPAGVAKPIAMKPTVNTAPKRPQNGRTFSSTSTVHPHDSISAVNVPTTNTTLSPAAKRRLSAKPPLVKKTVPTTQPAAGKDATLPTSKSVNVDPVMLMRMKAGKGTTPKQPKNVSVDPAMLARMKAGNGKKS
jgi:1-acyl-sn-glycerol-3-phosphate acyltransferase